MTKKRGGWRFKRDETTVPRGEASPFFKGDNAVDSSKRERARKLYPNLGSCEMCAAVAVERHHKDGNTGNNSPENIAILCRRCHMETDGRLVEFIKAGQHPPQPPKACADCGRLYKPLRQGRCGSCSNRHYRSCNSAKRDRLPDELPL